MMYTTPTQNQPAVSPGILGVYAPRKALRSNERWQKLPKNGHGVMAINPTSGAVCLEPFFPRNLRWCIAFVCPKKMWLSRSGGDGSGVMAQWTQGAKAQSLRGRWLGAPESGGDGSVGSGGNGSVAQGAILRGAMAPSAPILRNCENRFIYALLIFLTFTVYSLSTHWLTPQTK